MHYVILTLAAILIGTAIGALWSSKGETLLVAGSSLAIALGIATLITGAWTLLAVGAAVFLLVQGLQRKSRRA